MIKPAAFLTFAVALETTSPSLSDGDDWA